MSQIRIDLSHLDVNEIAKPDLADAQVRRAVVSLFILPAFTLAFLLWVLGAY